ncbi:hypothetical protein ACEPAH_7587 [Sanghuangporus vaninii]
MSNSNFGSSKREILVGFGIDADGVSGWLGRGGGGEDPVDISRGMYAGEVGIPRLLKLFEQFGIKTTWFVPGHSLETFPDQLAAVRDAGHEIGLHGYSHENQKRLNIEQEREVFNHTINLLTDFCGGVSPKGNVAPFWETSREGIKLLLDKGIEYDHSYMAHDSQAYYLREGDSWTSIDYDAKAETWMRPLQRGSETGLVELPANWYLDDFPPLVFVKSRPNSHGWVNTRDVEDLWKDTFSYLYREEKDFIFPITIHPDASGRPHVLMMLERFITWVNTHEHVRWVPFIEMARAFRAKQAPVPGATMPSVKKQSS